MASLLSSILYSSQALSAEQTALQTTSKNIANVNTVGYARERANFATEPDTAGVQVASVQSLRDSYLDAQVVGENSVTSMLQTKYDSMSRAQSDLGESINSSTSASSVTDTGSSGTGINSALTSFFNGFQAVASDPTDSSQKQVLLQSAGALADTINTADSNLAGEQANNSQRITGDVSDANQLLTSIAGLNKQIASAEAGNPGSATSLRDQRQSDIESLSQKMDIRVTTSADNASMVQISGRDANGNAVPLVANTAVVNPLSYDGTTVSAGASGQSSTALSVTGGSIAGAMQASDVTIAGLRANLKTMANQLTSAVNSAYNPTGQGANFFSATPASGSLIQVDPATTASTLITGSTSDAGANDIALAVANVATKTFSTAGGDAINGTISGYYSGVVSNFGSQISNVDTQIGNQALVSQQIDSQRDAVSGVSLDEETTNLLQYQKAYEASSKVVSVIDSMMDDVLNMITASSA